jgi:hypothetical protein
MGGLYWGHRSAWSVSFLLICGKNMLKTSRESRPDRVFAASDGILHYNKPGNRDNFIFSQEERMKNRPPLLALGAIVLAMLACNISLDSGAAMSQGQIDTLAAQTMSFLQWQTYAAQGTQAPPPTVEAPTNQSPPTSTFTGPPPPANTPMPSVTLTSLPCNWAQFISDVTVPDNWETTPNDHFTKTWRLKNIGSCTWTSGYSLVFDHGDQMGAPASQQLTTGTVAPGQTVDVSVDLVSPAADGTYQGYFKLKASDSTIFGIGSSADGAFWVKIVVTAAAGWNIQQMESQTTIGMGSVGHVSVNCPSGSEVVGGGFDGGNNIATYRSERSGNGWVVYGHRYSGANSTLKVYAYCLSGVTASSTSGYMEKTLTPGQSGNQSYSCTGSSVVTGGGFAFTDGVIWAYRLIMDGNGLKMYAQNTGASAGMFRPHPVCLNSSGAVTVRATNTGSVPASSSGTVEAGCPAGTTVTGGGFTLSANMTLTGMYKKPGQEKWVVKILNITGSNLNASADAICLAFS